MLVALAAGPQLPGEGGVRFSLLLGFNFCRSPVFSSVFLLYCDHRHLIRSGFLVRLQ